MVRRKLTSSFSKHEGKNGDTSKTEVLISRNMKKKRKRYVLQEIHYLRKTVSLVLPKAPFARLVREIIVDLFPDSFITRMQATALEALQEACEAYLVQFFEDCVLVAQHAKRVTVQIHDMVLLRRLRGRDDVINR